MNYLHILVILASLVALGAAVIRHKSVRRERSLRHLIERAEALETLFHNTRERMKDMRSVVDRVPQDIAATAHASLDSHDLVQQGLRNVLEHRLWISQHGLTASQKELDTACEAMDRAYESISTQFTRLELAGAELANATQAVIEQAAREPAALTRRPEE